MDSRLANAIWSLEALVADPMVTGATRAAAEQALRPLKALRPKGLYADNERYREVSTITGREVTRSGWAPDRPDHPAVDPGWRDRDRA